MDGADAARDAIEKGLTPEDDAGDDDGDLRLAPVVAAVSDASDLSAGSTTKTKSRRKRTALWTFGSALLARTKK